MTQPKLHHYVPAFYLRRFSDTRNRLWVWERDNDRIFPATPRSVAVETNFYLLPELANFGLDPLSLEHQLSDVEAEMAAISTEWIERIRAGHSGELIPIPEPNRDIASLFVTLQFLRTASMRSLLAALSADLKESSDGDLRSLHADLMWNESLVDSLAGRVRSSSWVFAYNGNRPTFITSDNPVAFRSSDNRRWIKLGLLHDNTYVVYPLAPDVIMYCFPKSGRWLKSNIDRYDSRISPVTLTRGMVDDENSAQVFMANRFVISAHRDFEDARQFAKNIRTDLYKPD